MPKRKQKPDQEALILKNQLARALADYDNLSKRVERENAEMHIRVTARVVRQLLPVFDMVSDTQRHLKDAGLAMAMAQLIESLKALGIEQIKAEPGMAFDEALHEAVDSVDDEKRKAGEIVSVALSGWKFVEGPVIRHAKVVV